MARAPKAIRLSDGTTIAVRIRPTIIGLELLERSDRKRPNTCIVWQDERMYLVTDRQWIRITHPKYAYAANAAEAALVALAFFADSAEEVIAHAMREGCTIDECYGVSA